MQRGYRTSLLVIVLLVVLACAMSLLAANSDESAYGPNLLPYSPDVESYIVDDAGVPIMVRGTLTEAVQRGSEIPASLAFFEQNRAAYRIANPAQDLQLKSMAEDNFGNRHLRFNQYHDGVRIFGAQVVTHFGNNGVMRAVNGDVVTKLNLPSTKPSLSGAAAETIARTDVAAEIGPADAEESELVIFQWEGSDYLVWRTVMRNPERLGRWEYFIDAINGEIIYKANRIMDTEAIGTGTNVLGLPRNHIDTDFTGSTYQMKDFTRQAGNNVHGHDGQMPSGAYLQTNIAGASLPGSIATDADNVWNAGGSQAAAVDGHVYSAVVYDWWLDQFGRNSFNNSGASMLTIVNYSGEGTNNAYWDGLRIVVWAAGTGWRSLATCPDVIAHEWGHAVTENESDLVYQKESGALNESFSDMMGAAFEWAHDTLDTPDWLMGENGQTSGAGFRNMADPHAAGDPDTYGTGDPFWIDVNGCSPSQFNDYCGVHTNSGVGNKWFYLLSDGGTHNGVTVDGIGVAEAIKVALQANMNYWTPNIVYYDAAVATVTAADDIDPSGAYALEVAKAWNAVGVAVPFAAISFNYPNGVPSTLVPNQLTTFLVDVAGVTGGTPLSGTGKLHYRIDGGAWVQTSMLVLSPNHYQASLPQIDCLSEIEFYVTAEEAVSGEFSDPSPNNPFRAIAVENSSTVMADNFESDLGWTTGGNASAGQWERGLPAGGGDRGDPASDFDGSGQCYLTGRLDGDTDVDGGTTILYSPTFNLSSGDGYISYARWYSNVFGAAPNADVMEIYISNNNGSSWTLVETVGPVTEASGGWVEAGFFASDYVTPTGTMMMRFDASDLGDGSVVEAAIDAFDVTIYSCTSTQFNITTPSIPDWTAGVPFSLQLEAENGQGQLTWTDANNGLAGTGLSLSTSGLISGTPISAQPIQLRARATDQGGAFTFKLYAFDVNSPVSIAETDIPDWTEGVAYSQQLTIGGGTGALTIVDRDGDLAGTGLSLSGTGLVSGTPSSAGTIQFVVSATDGVGSNAEQTLVFDINQAPEITTVACPDGIIDEAYSFTLESQFGTAPIGWSNPSGNLAAAGLSLSPAGILSGTPTVDMTVTFTARVTDAAGAQVNKQFEFDVAPAYICGDADGSEMVSIADAVMVINYIFGGGGAPDPIESADVDCSGNVSISDAVFIINFIFGGGDAPCSDCP